MSMKRLYVAAMVAAAIWAGCAPAQTPAAEAAEQRAIGKTIRAILDAAEKKELDRLDSFHLYGPKFTKFDEAGHPRLDSAAAQAAERQGIIAMKGFRAMADDLRVDVFGTAAVATFVMNYTSETAAGKIARQRRCTMVFAKDGDNWKIVHEHFSLLNSAP